MTEPVRAALWQAIVERAEALHDDAVTGQRRARSTSAARLGATAQDIATLARAVVLMSSKRR